jgi:hypothetical protein
VYAAAAVAGMYYAAATHQMHSMPSLAPPAESSSLPAAQTAAQLTVAQTWTTTQHGKHGMHNTWCWCACHSRASTHCNCLCSCQPTICLGEAHACYAVLVRLQLCQTLAAVPVPYKDGRAGPSLASSKLLATC